MRICGPISVDPDHLVLSDSPSGDLHRVVAIDRTDGLSSEVLFTLTGRFSGLDMAEDGTVFVDQQNNTLEVLRINRSGGSVQRIAKAETYFLRSHTVELSGWPGHRSRSRIGPSEADVDEDEQAGNISYRHVRGNVGTDHRCRQRPRCFPARERTGEVCRNRIAFGSPHHSQDFSTRCGFNRSVGLFSGRQDPLLRQRQYRLGSFVRWRRAA